MDRASLRARARALDERLQSLASEYEALWENLQAALDDGATWLDPDLTVGNRMLGLATGIPHLGRVFGRQDPPMRRVSVVTSSPGDDRWVQAVFLSEARARAWVAEQPWPDRFKVEAHALEHPERTAELGRPREADADSLAAEADALSIDPADLAEALAASAQMEELAADLRAADQPVLGRLRYEGVLYMRPGSGVILDESGDEFAEAVERVVEQAIDRSVSGDFVRARVVVEVLADDGSGPWPRETNDP